MLKGTHQSEETKAKLRAIANAQWGNPLNRLQASLTHKGKPLSAWHKTRISLALTGSKHPFYGKHHTCQAKAKNSAKIKARWQMKEYREKLQRIRQALWQNPEYVMHQIKSRGVKPNKAELKLQSFLDKHFHNTWEYVGDGQLIIGGRCPDFVNVNGAKEIIELFGAYWHSIFEIAERKEHYRKYGFKLAIIWDDELENETRLLKVFNKKFK